MHFTRFLEPSTWAGIGIIAQVLARSFGIVNPDLSVVFDAVSGGAAGLAVLLRENAGNVK